jgi:hypothetical protein
MGWGNKDTLHPCGVCGGTPRLCILEYETLLWGDSKSPSGLQEGVGGGLAVDVILRCHHGIKQMRNLDGLQGLVHDVPVAAACDCQWLGSVVEPGNFHHLHDRGDMFAKIQKNSFFSLHKRLDL